MLNQLELADGKGSSRERLTKAGTSAIMHVQMAFRYVIIVLVRLAVVIVNKNHALEMYTQSPTTELCTARWNWYIYPQFLHFISSFKFWMRGYTTCHVNQMPMSTSSNINDGLLKLDRAARAWMGNVYIPYKIMHVITCQYQEIVNNC